MPDVWLSGSRSLKSTYFLSSIFFNWVSLIAGGMNGFWNVSHGLLEGLDNTELLDIPVPFTFC